MTQSEQSPQPEEKDSHPLGPPKAIGVYERPQSSKRNFAPIIALVLIILLSLLAFWLVPMLF